MDHENETCSDAYSMGESGMMSLLEDETRTEAERQTTSSGYNLSEEEEEEERTEAEAVLDEGERTTPTGGTT